MQIPSKYSYIVETLEFIDSFKRHINDTDLSPEEFLESEIMVSIGYRNLQEGNPEVLTKMRSSGRNIIGICTHEESNDTYEYGFLSTVVNDELSELFYDRYGVTLNVVCAGWDSSCVLWFLIGDPHHVTGDFLEDNVDNHQDILDYIKNYSSGYSDYYGQIHKMFYHVY